MVTDSVAFCANVENSGSAKRGLGAAHTSVGANNAKKMRKMQLLISQFLIAI